MSEDPSPVSGCATLDEVETRRLARIQAETDAFIKAVDDTKNARENIRAFMEKQRQRLLQADQLIHSIIEDFNGQEAKDIVASLDDKRLVELLLKLPDAERIDIMDNHWVKARVDCQEEQRILEAWKRDSAKFLPQLRLGQNPWYMPLTERAITAFDNAFKSTRDHGLVPNARDGKSFHYPLHRPFGDPEQPPQFPALDA